MFVRSHFRIRKQPEYPQFIQVVQSWYSPMLLDEAREDAGLSACVTLGVANNPYKKEGNKDVILASCVNGHISDVLTFQKHVKCLAHDYLNKGTKPSASIRAADVVIVEAKYKENNRVIKDLKLDNLRRFYPDLQGASTLHARLNIAMPYICKIGLTNIPGESQLRPDDAELLGLLLAYPAPESYAIVSAVTQAVIYLKNSGVFDETAKTGATYKPPSKGFYGRD